LFRPLFLTTYTQPAARSSSVPLGFGDIKTPCSTTPSLGSNLVREQLAPIVGPREFEGGRDQMVSTRSMVNEKMSKVEQTTLMMSLRRERDEMKNKNEEEILAL